MPDKDPDADNDSRHSGGDGAGEFGFRRAAAKVREFPQEPGVYLFKDLHVASWQSLGSVIAKRTKLAGL